MQVTDDHLPMPHVLRPALFLLFILIFQSPSYPWSPFFNKTFEFPEEKERLLEDGDLICRMGIGVWSQLFRDSNRTDKRFSHCGILVRKDGKWFVIHSSANDATGEGCVAWEPLEKFAARCSLLAVYRFPFSGEERHRIAACSRTYKDVPFDCKFDIQNHDQVYCSELVYLCVNEALKQEILKPEKLNDKPQITVDDLYLKTGAKLILELKP